ncbi:MAG: imidazole glycerol phosphate synthase cyclase subunit [Gammaproteobacteria bacterium]|nr:imidazole glycerol phosphate synthase cyclase subunit [Gammaproteobacteria bacterium]|tara:strand:- start:323 stop:1111 length:789 start_codon:yes stop_codon:yes gene_type:complete
MLKTRLIPVLLLKNGLLVRSEGFEIHQIIGNPINEVDRFNQWNVDELIYIDISEGDKYDLGRDDSKLKGLNDPLDILKAVSKNCLMPLTWGGRIKDLDDIHERISFGADKVTINSQAFKNPSLITEGAKKFGSQAIVVNIDVFKNSEGVFEVYIDRGKNPTGESPESWAKKVQDLGAGEILLQSINNDGLAKGYDLDLISKVTSAVNIPVIALGGVGEFSDYPKGIHAGASAVAAANLWHFKELADRLGKKSLREAGIEVRS